VDDKVYHLRHQLIIFYSHVDVTNVSQCYTTVLTSEDGKCYLLRWEMLSVYIVFNHTFITNYR